MRLHLILWLVVVLVREAQGKYLRRRPNLVFDFYQRAYEHIRDKYPFWNRHEGKDHIWVRTHLGKGMFSQESVWVRARPGRSTFVKEHIRVRAYMRNAILRKRTFV